MHYTGEIYRPHVEAMTPMLEVTSGCSYNMCAFCTMYDRVPFQMTKESILKKDLAELRDRSKSPIRRLLLLSGDPIALPMEDLRRLGVLIKDYLSQVNTITSYASIGNIQDKSLEELKELRELGFREFHIGIETGNEKALALLNKGYTIQDIFEALEKLQKANIEYHAIIMAGVAGKGTYAENVKDTLKILEAYPPITLSVYPTIVKEGSQLAKLREEGKYIESSQREKILGQIKLLEEAKLPDKCFYSGNFVYNLLPATSFFKDRENLINHFKNYLQEADPDILDRP